MMMKGGVEIGEQGRSKVVTVALHFLSSASPAESDAKLHFGRHQLLFHVFLMPSSAVLVRPLPLSRRQAK